MQLIVAELDGCCYILRPDLVLARAADCRAVRWIAFATDGHVTRCHWATEAESKVITHEAVIPRPLWGIFLLAAGWDVHHRHSQAEQVPPAQLHG